MPARLRFSLLLFFLAACGGSPETPTPAIFIPPTPAATPSPLASPTATEPDASPTPDCTDDLQFLEDLTIPDGSVVLPGEALDKRWLVQNTGSCNWEAGYRLKLISGPEMGAEADQPLLPATAGSEATIRILYTAPQEPGYYLSEWQAYGPQGDPFGVSIFIEIVVQE